jgi:hypothetical protein
MVKLSIPAALGAFALLGSSAVHAAPLDLSTFVKVGGGSGSWNVAADKLSVTQTANTSLPTGFVSPVSFINSSFDGTFEVLQGAGDDDYIGFIFGWTGPANPFWLVDWKELDQSGSFDGFTLAYVTGGTTAIPIGNHQNDAAGYDVVATDVDTAAPDPKGWDEGVEYDFRLTYQTNRILIEVGGGSPLGANLQTIFDITPNDVSGVTAFLPGQFGFYNYSQRNVRYAGFTQTAAPIPVPAAFPLLATALGGLIWLRRQR